VVPEVIVPEWPAPPRVRAFVTTRALGDMRKGAIGRERLRALLPAEPLWLHQVHGTRVHDAHLAGSSGAPLEGDSFVLRGPGPVCAIQAADCMPVLLACDGGEAVGLAHAGWRGLAAGVIEATLQAMAVPPQRVVAWLGPAIGPRVYEVGDEVRDAFLGGDAAAAAAFVATRPHHWRLDLYAIARQRLARAGITRVFGGTLCTYSDRSLFFSFRRDRTSERMAALAWLE
jgi:purine-nucleoside/S-methyl-5'-thioadenosine phosphorylase / adenosine deaminase